MSSPSDVLEEYYHYDSEMLQAFLLRQESDRGCVIFGAALLEEALETLIRAACRTDEKSVKRVVDPLFKVYAPFSTFSAKIQVSFALGLIQEKLYRVLELVRKLRNTFAHEKTLVSFQSPKYRTTLRAIVEGCKSWPPPIEEAVARIHSKMADGTVKGITDAQFDDRLRFFFCVFILRSHILVARRVKAVGLEQALKEFDAAKMQR